MIAGESAACAHPLANNGSTIKNWQHWLIRARTLPPRHSAIVPGGNTAKILTHFLPHLPPVSRTSVATLACGVARITTRGVVNVVGHAGVVGVRIRLAVRMAVDAGESGVIRRIDMAGAAGRPYPRVRAGVNREPGVVESGPRPRSCVVAQRAGGGEGCRHVVGIGGALVILLVAGIAGRRRSCELIINVATGAGHGGVRAGQGEAGQVVIKAGRHPRRGGMAHLALLREAGGRVIGIVGVLEILEVARHA